MSNRGVIKIKYENVFWGIYIPKTDELLVTKRMGDIKQTLFDHFNVEKMTRPDVDILSTLSGPDEEYDEKVSSLRRVMNSTVQQEESKLEELKQTVARFASAEVHIRDTAEFFKTTQKKINELMRG